MGLVGATAGVVGVTAAVGFGVTAFWQKVDNSSQHVYVREIGPLPDGVSNGDLIRWSCVPGSAIFGLGAMEIVADELPPMHPGGDRLRLGGAVVGAAAALAGMAFVNHVSPGVD